MAKTLKDHEEVCSIRYAAIEARLTNLEVKIDKIEAKMADLRLDFFKIMVGTAGSIITAIIGAVAVIKWH